MNETVFTLSGQGDRPGSFAANRFTHTPSAVRGGGTGAMGDHRIRAATPADLDAVLAFGKGAAEGTSISDDPDGVARLIARDSEALLKAAEERFAALGGRRGDAMVLDRNAPAHHAWSAAGYVREPQWSRWVKPLDA